MLQMQRPLRQQQLIYGKLTFALEGSFLFLVHLREEIPCLWLYDTLSRSAEIDGQQPLSFEILGRDNLCYNRFIAQKRQVVRRRQINFSAVNSGYVSPGRD
jgi:hypothetical protein